MALGLSRQQKGNLAERTAEKFLRKQGLKLVQRNFSGRYGEIDLIMLDQEILVFIEVRSRNNDQFGSALETIDSRKQAKLIKTAELYLSKNKTEANCRFDTVDFNGDIAVSTLRWIPNAFST